MYPMDEDPASLVGTGVTGPFATQDPGDMRQYTVAPAAQTRRDDHDFIAAGQNECRQQWCLHLRKQPCVLLGQLRCWNALADF